PGPPPFPYTPLFRSIDDPDAFPEWTGACGTVHGRQVHMREKIPMCDPCRKAHAERAAELKEYTFDHARLVELMDRKHMSLAQMRSEEHTSELQSREN